MPKKCCISIALLFSLFTSGAQYRIGGIDVEKLWEHLPKLEVNRYDSILNNYQDSLNNEYEKLQKNISAETEKFLVCRAGAVPPSDSERNAIRERHINLIQKAANFESSILKLLEQKSSEVKALIYNKMKEQIKPIAFEIGYDIIIDLCGGKIFSLPHCNDVSELVLKKLGWLH